MLTIGSLFSGIGATPVIPETSVLGPRMGRGKEIAAWLHLVPVDTFAIVDDDSDMGNHIDRLVQTTHEHGLLDSPRGAVGGDVGRVRLTLGTLLC